MIGRRRGIALLLVVVALATVDAVLVLLWLWSRAEARDAVESLAVSRAEWAATAAMTDAVAWLSQRDGLRADTVLQDESDTVGAARKATLHRLAVDLVEVRAEGRVPASGDVLVRRVRCRWMGLGARDSTGVRRFQPFAGAVPAPCW